jgi:hypothetical protein
MVESNWHVPCTYRQQRTDDSSLHQIKSAYWP